MRPRKQIVYYPNMNVRAGLAESFIKMASELVRSRELILRLFLRDFRAKYKQSFLGVSWAVIMPFITIAVFVYLKSTGIVTFRVTEMPYIVFALIGISTYGIFSGGLLACSTSIVSVGKMVKKINFPKISLVFAAFGQVFVDFMVRLILIVLACLLLDVTPSWKSVFFPLVLLPLILLTLGLGLLLSILTAIARDTQNILSIFTMFIMFLTPVVYPISDSNPLRIWNPLSHFVVSARELIVMGTVSNVRGLLFASAFALFVFAVSWRVFYIAEIRIAERI